MNGLVAGTFITGGAFLLGSGILAMLASAFEDGPPADLSRIAEVLLFVGGAISLAALFFWMAP